MNEILKKLSSITKSNDLIVAVGLVLVLVVMIVPIHPIILDLCLALTMAFSIIILLVAIYAKRPLDFNTFPTILLISTLFRLALNVSSTRNILLRSQTDGLSAAGEIIRSFGSFVVGGNYAVGIIIFVILIIINFVVITKGAGRVAEVGARFTLDAMPGKQMAIDADLNAGLIDEKQARQRRHDVAAEADFYGAMDGASKFVRGDAIAGLLITVINIVGGVVIGVLQYGLEIADAAELFTLLTIGDGLVTQIPALIISTAAGVIITRGQNNESFGDQVTEQFKLHPKAMYSAGSILLIFAIIPGLPKFPFLAIGFFLFFLGYKIEQTKESEAIVAKKIQTEIARKMPENLEDLLPLELVELEVGYGLVNLVDAEQNGELLERITQLRKQFALDWGVIIPSIRIKDNLELKPGGYSIKIKGLKVAKGELMPDHFLAMDPGTVIDKIDGIRTTEPVFGLEAVWITEDNKEEAQYSGHTVVDLPTVMATHITEIIKTHLHEIFGRQELESILTNLKERNPKIVSDLIPEICSTGCVLKVLQNLLREGVSIRDVRTILEVLAENGIKMKDPDALTELVRQSLYRTVTEKVKGNEGDVPLFILDKNIEEVLAGHLVQTEQGMKLSVDPKITQNILSSLNEKIEEATGMGEKMVVLCSPIIRGHFKRLTEKFIPNLVVISHNELSPEIHVRNLGTVRL